ncbi:MAG TPA: glycosyltransferase family 4 protein [Candidatus Paceibacterota bacterium]
MRIIFITSKLNFKTSGGSVDEMDIMMRFLKSYGNDVTAVTVFSGINNIDRPLPYKVIEEEIKSKRLLGIQWAATKIFLKHAKNADVIHTDGHLLLYAAGLYRFLGGKAPVVLFFNRELMAWPLNSSDFLAGAAIKRSIFKKIKEKARWFVERYLMMPIVRYADYYTFTNPLLQKAYEDFGLKTAGKAWVFCDPYDLDYTLKKNNISESFYETHNKGSGRVTLYYSSRMAPGKGFDLLIRAFAKVKNKENFKLILGGTGPEESLIKKMVRDLGLEQYTEFPGWVTREELYEALKRADIYIMARWRKEITAMSLNESMAFGLPSIVPAGGALEWVVGKSALCFKQDDPDDLAKKIEELGDNYELRAELSRQCFVRLHEENMDYKKTLPHLYQILKNLAAGGL